MSGALQWPDWSQRSRGERPREDPSRLEIWGYAGSQSYTVGEQLSLHVSTTAPVFEVVIFRDGSSSEIVYRREGIEGKLHPTPPDAYATGCGWPATFTMPVPDEWRPGAYRVEFRVSDQRGSITQEGFFLVRPRQAGSHSPIAMILATYTWQAYNDWGGGSFYSLDPPVSATDGEDRGDIADSLRSVEGFSSRLSMDRPWARGLIRQPVGAPRIAMKHPPRVGWSPRREQVEWAFAQGFSSWCGNAGWASYDGHFLRWAERAGYDVELLTQWDLDQDPNCLDAYRCVVTVGHDEYWTATGREVLDQFVERGGHYARFAGNILWQIRLEDDGRTQVCHKYVPEADPLAEAEDRGLRTGCFESLAIADPPVTTFGANGARGIYSRFDGMAPRGVGGFVVYRNDHWAFAGTDLYYADVLGSSVPLVGYESDGVAYTFEQGLPVPTHEDGAPDGLEILALTPVVLEEEDHSWPDAILAVRDGDLAFTTRALFGDDTPELRAKIRYGSAVITSMKKGAGEVFCGGSTEWPYALYEAEPTVEQVVRNVLERFSRPTD